MKNKLLQAASIYFDAFYEKNLEKLKPLYHSDIILNEWNTNFFRGIDEVLAANAKLFNEYTNFDVSIMRHAVNEHTKTVMVEIDVQLDDLSIMVVDVITFDDDLLIISIDAFKGF